MIRFGAIVVLCSLLAVGFSHSGNQNSNQCNGVGIPSRRECNVCQGTQPRDVTLRVRNVLREPFFEEVVKISCTRYKTLFYIMQQAAEVNSVFKFQATYFRSLGFFIDAINNVQGTWNVDRSWWQILDGNLLLTDVGASSYVPAHNEVVTFNLTSGDPH
ncbi:uncharacterized protein LOC112557704 [Pomacea canaliculata]|uniref:uncharacterized protein LOC112557704 n=1 Tax=Pomacea canaliculata TaxID=400727 RepID=UPI000D725CFC|nr:uncharacterized protein LOC112557704 [Pomacea canaliculata]